jgi:ADP-ribose pyrophosphatase YjhB (NUDIX family)
MAGSPPDLIRGPAKERKNARLLMSDPRPPPPPPHPFTRAIPEGDDRERLICSGCGFVLYDNPKIVVGSVVRWGDKILMCRRAIDPRRGFWTLPAGYLELNESTRAGAEREAWEEAHAKIAIETLLAIYDIPRISQVQLIYRARLIDDTIAAGPESLEIGLFGWNDIPWDEIAFPSVRWALRHEKDVQASGDLTPRSTPLDPAGPPPNPAAPQGR